MERLEQSVNKFVKDNGLKVFFKPGDTFVKDITQRAAALSGDANTSSIYNNPENIAHLTSVSLYQLVIYCDDSSSMESDNRYDHQVDLVVRITQLATKILPKGYGVDLRFINNDCRSRLSANEIETIVRNVRPTGGTPLGTNLRTKILLPLVYSILESGKRLKRPILVCTITDGCPINEPEGMFKDAIVECRKKLIAHGHKPTAVKFLISQVGNDPDAEKFFEKLRNDSEIEDMIHCVREKVDEKLKQLKGTEGKLEEWLLETLMSPILYC